MSSKYGNKKIAIDGIIFDSQLEAAFYVDLKEMLKKGEIYRFERQVKVKICPAYTLDGKNIAAANYVLDYVVYYEKDGFLEKAYIDTKGFGTEVSKLKKKIAQYVLGEKILWLEKNYQFGCKKYGWIDQDELKKKIKENIKKNKKSIAKQK